MSTVRVRIDKVLTLFEEKRKNPFQRQWDTEVLKIMLSVRLHVSSDFSTAIGEECCLFVSQQDVILKRVVTHCFEQPNPLQLMSCSLLIMFLLFRTGYCYFLHLHFINFCFCFDNTNTLCHLDFPITLGHFSVSYSGLGAALVYQNKRGGHCDNVWTLNGWLGVSHHLQGFVFKVFTFGHNYSLYALGHCCTLCLLLRKEMRRDPSACSITGRLISQIHWHFGDHAESTENLCMLHYRREKEEEPIW